MPMDKLSPMFRCPKSGAELDQCKTDLWISKDCDEHVYPVIGGVPILISPDLSLFSVNTDDVFSTVVKRRKYNKFVSLIKCMVSPPLEKTKQNIALLLQLLQKNERTKNVLVIGGGSIGQGLFPLYQSSQIQIVAFDVYATDNVQFVADSHNIPLESAVFDAVVIQAVLEHVLVPEKVVTEIHRLLKDDGLIYAETPFLQHVHEGAYDFMRFTETGHRFLFRSFSLIKSGACAGPGVQTLWSVDYLFRSVFRSRIVGKIAKLLFFWLQYLDYIIPDSYASDAASGVFFLGKKNVKSVSAKKIVLGYRGAQ